MAAVRECNFRTGRILGKHFPEALVHTVQRTRACGTRPMDSMDLCFRKTLSQNSSRAEIRHSLLKVTISQIIVICPVEQTNGQLSLTFLYIFWSFSLKITPYVRIIAF